MSIIFAATLLASLAIHAKEDENIFLMLEEISAPFDTKAVIEIEQKDGKYKKYAPADHKTFNKEVDERDLEITEFHIKDRKIIKLVFSKKLEKK